MGRYLLAAFIIIVGTLPLATVLFLRLRDRRSARVRAPLPSLDEIVAKARADAERIEVREVRRVDLRDLWDDDDDDGAGPI